MRPHKVLTLGRQYSSFFGKFWQVLANNMHATIVSCKDVQVEAFSSADAEQL